MEHLGMLWAQKVGRQVIGTKIFIVPVLSIRLWTIFCDIAGASIPRSIFTLHSDKIWWCENDNLMLSRADLLSDLVPFREARQVGECTAQAKPSLQA